VVDDHLCFGNLTLTGVLNFCVVFELLLFIVENLKLLGCGW